MIQWKRENIFNLLCIFGDNKPHEWMEVINLGTRLFVNIPINTKHHATHQAKFEEFFKKAVNYGLVNKLSTKYIQTIKTQNSYQLDEKDYVYKLSAKGDRLLRQEQAERTADGFYYNMFDRSVDGKFGIDRFAPLTPTDYTVKEKHTYRIPRGSR